MARHFKIDELGMDEAVKADFIELLRNPGNTVDALFAWLTDHGFKIGRTAVHNYRANFEETLKSVRQASELARAFAAVAKEGGGTDLSEAALARLQQVLMGKLFAMDAEGDVDAKDLMALAAAVKNAVGTRQTIAEIREQENQIKAEAIKAAEATAKAGGGGAAVVATIKKALGIAA